MAVAASMGAGEAALQKGARHHEPELTELGGDATLVGGLLRTDRHVLPWHEGIHHLRDSTQYIYGVLSVQVATAITDWRPRSLTQGACDFARMVVSAALPPTPARARALLYAAGRLATFCISVGLEPRPEVALHPSVIERFIVVGCRDASGPTRRTLRTNLRFVAARCVPGLGPAPVALPRERSKAPYSKGEVASYLALAGAQPTLARRMRASGLICLGAGAGIMGADLRHVRGHDVACRSGGVVVEVAGRRPRVVPVLSSYHEALLASASFAGDSHVIGGADPDRHNLSTPLIASLSGGVDLPRVDTGRLRATWLVACVEAIGLKAFMDAAGIACSQRLGDLVATLPTASEPAAVALLGGRS